jgi:large subunit ribosomal protein L25
MLMIKLIGIERVKASNHDAKKLRRNGKIPAILYGMKKANTLLEFGAIELNKQIAITGEHGELIITIDGVDRKTLIKEIQREPVDHKLTHIDLEEVDANKIIVTEVSLHFINEDGVRTSGGILQKEKNSIKVQCAEGIMPKYITVDFAGLQIGDTVRAGDVKVEEGVTVLDDEKTVIASITGADAEEEEVVAPEKTEVTAGAADPAAETEAETEEAK